MLWKDPDRWVDADMQRNEWVRIGIILIILIIFGTVILVTTFGMLTEAIARLNLDR